VSLEDVGTTTTGWTRALVLRVRGSGAVIATQAKGMTGRIQEDADVCLGLELSQLCAQGHCVGHGFIEVLDLDVEVHHRPLVAR